MPRPSLPPLVLASIAAVLAPRARAAEGTALAGTDLRIGPAISSGRLAIYPIYGPKRAAGQKVVSFDAAREGGDVSVREIEGGGSVGTVVVENRGKLAILIMAGTVIKGGKQDRQIGQDVVVAPGARVQVDAFCVEHGRWDEERQGRTTDGLFVGSGTLAPRKVREAGQYRKDQGKVWENVSKENEAHGKSAPSDTLLASLDDAEIRKRTERLARELDGKLRALPAWKEVVGLAYAVGGEIGGARWFHDHELEVESQPTLLATMAVEAVAPGAEAAPPSPGSVARFLADLRASKVKEIEETRSLNRNRLRESAEGWSSETMVGDVEVSADYMKK